MIPLFFAVPLIILAFALGFALGRLERKNRPVKKEPVVGLVSDRRLQWSASGEELPGPFEVHILALSDTHYKVDWQIDAANKNKALPKWLPIENVRVISPPGEVVLHETRLYSLKREQALRDLKKGPSLGILPKGILPKQVADKS